MRKIRIALADDHKLMRSGLRVLLEQQPDFTVVGEASDGREAVRLVDSQKPDVLVMDIGMPNLNGIEAAAQISQAHPEISIVMLSMHSDESYVLARAQSRSQRISSEGFRRNRSDPGRPFRRRAKSFFSPAVSKVLLDDYVRKLKRSGTEDPYDLLTPREREVLQLVAEGKSNKDVANLLNLSVYTVETHRSNIMEKLNLHGVPELILYAVRKGIIS